MSDAPFMVGHVHLKVRDLPTAVEFYTEILGLRVTERVDRFTFLSWGERHHDVALQGIGDDAPARSTGVGLYHAAFEVAQPDVLRTIYERLRHAGLDVVPIDHGISKALYFDDPSGNGLEVYLDTRGPDGHDEWAGQSERFDPTALPAESRDE